MHRIKSLSLIVILIFSLQGCMGCESNGEPKVNPLDDPLLSSDVPAAEDTALIYTASDGNDLEIFMANAATGETTQLTNNDVNDSGPIALPDGSLIVYICDDGADHEICLLNTMTGRSRQLTNDSSRNHIVAWLGSGRYLLTLRGRANDTLARYELLDLLDGSRETIDLNTIVGTDGYIAVVNKFVGNMRISFGSKVATSSTHMLVRHSFDIESRSHHYGVIDVVQKSYVELGTNLDYSTEWIDDTHIISETNSRNASQVDVSIFNVNGEASKIAEDVEAWSSCTQHPRLKAIDSERHKLITDKIVALIDDGTTLRVYDTLLEEARDIALTGTSERNEVLCNGGDRVAIIRDSEILILDVANGSETTWSHPADFARTAELSPDGNHLAYLTDEEELEPRRILNLTDGIPGPPIGNAGHSWGEIHPSFERRFSTDERYYQTNDWYDVSTANQSEPDWDYIGTVFRGVGAVTLVGNSTEGHLEIRPFDGTSAIPLGGSIPRMEEWRLPSGAQWIQPHDAFTIGNTSATPDTDIPQPEISNVGISCKQAESSTMGMLMSMMSVTNMMGLELETITAPLDKECSGHFMLYSRNASANLTVGIGSRVIPTGVSPPICDEDNNSYETRLELPSPWTSGWLIKRLSCTMEINPSDSRDIGEHKMVLTAHDADNSTTSRHSFTLVIEDADVEEE